MSLIEEVRSVQERVIARLTELGPAVAEYQELQRIAERLGIAERIAPLPPFEADEASRAASATPAAPARGRTAKPAARSTRAKPRAKAAGGTGRARKAATAKPASRSSSSAGRTSAGGKQSGRRGAAARKSAKAATASAADAQLDGRITAAVAAEPGLTVADLADRLGVAANMLYRPVRRLTDGGALAKRGRGLHPAG